MEHGASIVVNVGRQGVLDTIPGLKGEYVVAVGLKQVSDAYRAVPVVQALVVQNVLQQILELLAD